MHFPPEKPATQSHELLPISEEGTRLEPEEIERSMEDLVRKQKAKIQSQKVDIFKLRNSRKRYERKYRGVREQVAELEHKVGTASKAQEDTLEWKERRFRTIEDELRRAKELLAARSAELSTAQSFLPTADQLSETAVLGIVRDLNKNICQVAIDLTGELEKLMTSSSGRFFIPKKKIEGFSQLYGPVLVLHSLEGDPGVVELLIMSCICMIVTQITSSWRDDDLDTELDQLGSVYKRLSASGRCTPRTLAEFRLTHTRGAKNISQMEVLDPQSPRQPLISRFPLRDYYPTRRKGHIHHRLVLNYSTFLRFRKSQGIKRDRNNRATCEAFGVCVHGGHNVL